MTKTGQPAPRYYGNDGIHLSHSGVKRFLDGINRSCEIITDISNCVFPPATQRFDGANRPGFKPHYNSGSGTSQNSGYGRQRYIPAANRMGPRSISTLVMDSANTRTETNRNLVFLHGFRIVRAYSATSVTCLGTKWQTVGTHRTTALLPTSSQAL